MTTSRRFSGPFVVMFAMIIALVALAGPASANPYREQPTISVSSEHPNVGSRLRVCGSGFVSDRRVTVTLGRTELSSVVASHWGSFCTTIRVPDVTGRQWIVAEGAEGRTASVRIDIIGRDRGHGHGVGGHGVGDHGVGDQGVGGSSGVPVKAVPVDVLGVGGSSGVPVKAVPVDVLGVSANSSVPAKVAGVSANSSVPVKVAGVSASAGTTAVGSGLAFTGASVIGIGALGVLLLVGGGLMLLAGRRGKVNI
jgi:hypothetical protein